MKLKSLVLIALLGSNMALCHAITAYDYKFNQLIDHDGTSGGTFKQRYYIAECAYATDASPIFYYICGEYECSIDHLNSRGYLEDLVEKFQGRLVVLEHRYYGQSIPNNSLSTANLKYLTTDQALLDLAALQTYLVAHYHWTGKWIAIGGSYPGSLAAYYRMKYPDLVVGALASSAPVAAKEDFQKYDETIALNLDERCVKAIQSVIDEVEYDMVFDPNHLNETEDLFGAKDFYQLDFVDLLAEVVSSAYQAGEKDTFCKYLTKNKNYTENYAHLAHWMYDKLGVNAVDLVPQGAASEDPKDYHGKGLRQWLYQSCTEYGYWQVANENRKYSVRSQYLNLAYFRNSCQFLFGITTPVNTDYINQNFYAPLTRSSTSNIFFTNGKNDPWMRLSMAVENSNTGNPNLDYYTIANGGHHDDLSTPSSSDSKEVKDARRKFEELVKKWIK